MCTLNYTIQIMEEIREANRLPKVRKAAHISSRFFTWNLLARFTFVMKHLVHVITPGALLVQCSLRSTGRS